MDPDDFYDDFDEIYAFVESNRLAEEEFIKTWPAEYQKLKAEYC
jgi:hypothetical protein